MRINLVPVMRPSPARILSSRTHFKLVVVTVCPKTLRMMVLIRETWTRAVLRRYASFRNSRGGGSSVCTPCVLSSLTGPDMWGVLDGQRRPLAA